MSARKSKKKAPADDRKVVAQNRRARYDYEFLETIEAGIALVGSEVKALRTRGAQITQAFARIRNGEAWLLGAEIPHFPPAAHGNHRTDRARKLLLHRRQIRKLEEALRPGGLTLIPLDLHFNRAGFAKVELALARGRKKHDKRGALKEREARKEIRERR